jgi:rubrerythrin
VLEQVSSDRPLDQDDVQFFAAGSENSGDFQCADCSYGVAVRLALPRCPMCGGTRWERAVRAPVRRPAIRSSARVG